MRILNRKFLILGVVFFLIFIALVVLIMYSFPKGVSEENVSKSDAANLSPDAILKGTSFSPKTFSASDISGFFPLAKQAGESITWAGDWNELGDSKKFPHNFMEMSKQYDFVPIPIVGLYHQGEKRLIRPLTAETLTNYKKYAVEFVKKHKPAFFGMGVEVDIMFENHPAEFDQFVALFDETALGIKKVSPNTKVFTAFQLERIKGLRGGLFGGENDPSLHNWALLEKFPAADIIAFTTYPHLIYKSPSEIPADYYLEIETKTKKKIAFIETGWTSENIAASWESSEEEQAQFIEVFAKQIKPLDKALVIWPFVYDVDAGAAFKGLGLITKTDHEKLGWEKWKSLKFDD